MHDKHPTTPFWHRAGSIIGLIAMLAVILGATYRWVDGLAQYALDRQLHEIALHTPDAVTAGDLAIFALSLVVVSLLYVVFDPNLKRRATAAMRRTHEFLKPPPLSQEADAALAEQLVVNHARNRPTGI